MATNILELIGNTPILPVVGFDTGLCSLFVKLESCNPSGSIKDRPALTMIEDAEKAGVLRPGMKIIEATAGNTGLGLALVGSQKGYRCTFVVPDKMSREKVALLRAYGAEVLITRSDVAKGHPDYYQDRAKAIADADSSMWFADQFSNPSNARAHVLTTGPEIWSQMQGKVDAIVVGVGSGGTLGGLTQFFQSIHAPVEMVLADPVGSVITPYFHTGTVPSEVGSWLIEGIGEDFIPKNVDMSAVTAAYSIPDDESFRTARELLRTNGIMGGTTAGALVSAAIRYCREQQSPKRVVTFICDSGVKYLSKLFNDVWLREESLLARQTFGDLRDVVAYPFEEGGVVTVSPTEELRSAYVRMKTNAVSQLPVLQSGNVVGIVDESDLLSALQRSGKGLKALVQDVMTSSIKSVGAHEKLEDVLLLLEQGYAPLLMVGQKPYGLITKVDAVEYLRRKG